MADEEKRPEPPAYITYALFNRFINGLRDNGMPSRIDRSVISKMSGAEQSSLLNALRFLGLIRADGSITDRLPQLVDSEGETYKSVLRNVLTTSYHVLFESDIDLRTATGTQVADKFRDQQISGSTVTKSVAFFLAAGRDCGIEISNHVKPPQSARNGTTTTRRRRRRTNDGVDDPRGERKPPPPPPPSEKTWYQQLLEKFPTFDPAWDDETKNKWFDAFNDLMKKGGE